MIEVGTPARRLENQAWQVEVCGVNAPRPLVSDVFILICPFVLTVQNASACYSPGNSLPLEKATL